MFRLQFASKTLTLRKSSSSSLSSASCSLQLCCKDSGITDSIKPISA
ncbi:unnamed protein product [Schistosoma curassoni]|uniref:Uncharacterized protein n=1 Tax=Schistosoma curassoni TaxID=6186 RepID=A0A183JID1_9TREM|nr:unnamed protein product [Schistosoma curassoni]